MLAKCMYPSGLCSRKVYLGTFLAVFMAFSLFLVSGLHADTKNIGPKAGPDLGITKNPLAAKESISNTEVVSVAAIRKSRDGKTVRILFHERAQIFTLNTSEKLAVGHLRTLEDALKNRRPLKLTADHARATIKALAVPTAQERQRYDSLRKELLKAAKPLAIDLKKIEIAKFDDISNLKFPVWALCSKVVPSFAKAKEIFDYSARQSCNLPGPYDISPCIPFQYVRDGCYARAHKMRWIINNHFGYCSEKVFSFANQNDDELAVVASKWGGCCVTWWYHVAPVIRVKTPIVLKGGKTLYMTRAYVIDPGMFNEPVLLSTWLNAQTNTACSADARVSSYTIQPGSAYYPANHDGTAFTTDPSYAATDAKLIDYKNRVTCP